MCCHSNCCLHVVHQQPLSVDFSQAPILIDLELIRRLRRHLHSIKKTFTGKEFVDELLLLTAQEDTSELSTSEVVAHQAMQYSSEYAVELGQYLLNTGLLSIATTHLIHATPNPSEVEASVEVVRDRRTFNLALSYRFTEAEDQHTNIRKHQVFQAVKDKVNKKGPGHPLQPLEERGRLGTQLLITDILMQRSQHDRRLKEYINSNKFQEVMRTLTTSETVTCLCIVHL